MAYRTEENSLLRCRKIKGTESELFFLVTQPATGAEELRQHLYRNTAGLKITGDYQAAGRGVAALGGMPEVSSRQNDPSLPASPLHDSVLTEAALKRVSTCCSM